MDVQSEKMIQKSIDKVATENNLAPPSMRRINQNNAEKALNGFVPGKRRRIAQNNGVFGGFTTDPGPGAGLRPRVDKAIGGLMRDGLPTGNGGRVFDNVTAPSLQGAGGRIVDAGKTILGKFGRAIRGPESSYPTGMNANDEAVGQMTTDPLLKIPETNIDVGGGFRKVVGMLPKGEPYWGPDASDAPVSTPIVDPSGQFIEQPEDNPGNGFRSPTTLTAADLTKSGDFIDYTKYDTGPTTPPVTTAPPQEAVPTPDSVPPPAEGMSQASIDQNRQAVTNLIGRRDAALTQDVKYQMQVDKAKRINARNGNGFRSGADGTLGRQAMAGDFISSQTLRNSGPAGVLAAIAAGKGMAKSVNKRQLNNAKMDNLNRRTDQMDRRLDQGDQSLDISRQDLGFRRQKESTANAFKQDGLSLDAMDVETRRRNANTAEQRLAIDRDAKMYEQLKKAGIKKVDVTTGQSDPMGVLGQTQPTLFVNGGAYKLFKDTADQVEYSNGFTRKMIDLSAANPLASQAEVQAAALKAIDTEWKAKYPDYPTFNTPVQSPDGA